MESSISGVGVLDKTMIVLGALLPAPLGLNDLAVATGLPRATAYRLAVALETHGLLRRLDDGRFTLGLRLIGLGQAAAAGFPLALVARPILERLRDETGESVQLYVAEGELRRCVLSLQSPHGLRWIVPEGAILPLDRGSAGRALGGLPDGEAWTESVEEREKGVCSVSASVLGPDGQIAAALSVSGPVERLSRNPGHRFGRAVAASAQRLAEELQAVAS